ncbi:MAG: cation:proton antiporter, partial [Clostridia bacterium]|nr:cation:proton antiporter [Clostridia bacterium]
MEILISLSLSLLAGLLMSRLAKKFQLPAVTAYLVAGIILGPFCLGRLGVSGLGFTSLEEVESFGIISQTALGFIAFAIGNEFRVSQLKKTGKQAAVVGVIQAVIATIFVAGSLAVMHFIMPDKLSLPVALTLGAIASATAPAATLMVIRQYKAKGPVTDILLPIVALDDAVGLIIFAVCFGIAKAITFGAIDMVSIIVEPILEIVCSLILGFVMGVLFTFTEKFFQSRSKRLSISITYVLLAVGVSMMKFEVFG